MEYGLGSNQHAFVKRTSYSDWDSSGAVQGAYGNNYPRVGAIRFEGLHSSVIWADQEISQISFMIRFLAAGSNSAKTLTFWQGTKNTINGTGQSMIGAEMGSIAIDNAYNGVRTVVLSPTSNTVLFNAFVSWLQDAQTETLVVYRNEGAGSGDWSSNYLKLDATIINITYEPKGSKGTLSSASVDAGQNVSLTIDPLDVAGAVTHQVQWKFGDASSSVTTLPSGTTSTNYTIPLSWCNQIPNAVSGQATCVLTTLVNGSVSATRDIPFTVNVPASVVPSYSFESTPYETTGGYYQHIGKALLAIGYASSEYGATIVSYNISGGEGTNSNTSSVITDVFEESGSHVYTATVTDSRGRSTVKTLRFNVTAVSPIRIYSFLVQRYSEVIGDDGRTTYVASSDGDHVWVSLLASHDIAGGNNPASAAITWGASNSVSLPWGTSASISYTNDRTVITAQIPANTSVLFTLTVSDGFSSATASSQVEIASAILHVSPNGVGIGMYTLGTQSNPQLDIGYPMHARGGIAGVTIYSEDEQDTGGIWIDGKTIYRKTISGETTSSNGFIQIGEMPTGLAQVVRMYGTFSVGTQTLLIPNAFYQNLSYMVTPVVDGQTVSLALGSGFGSQQKQFALSIEYTKNTD